MPPNDKEHIFKPYVRDAKDRNGLGLGLAIVRALAAQLGHPLSLRSRVGRGSFFGLTLPRTEIALPTLPTTVEPHTASAQQGRGIFLLDDDVEIANATAALLRNWGAEVLIATSCSSARSLWRATEVSSIDLLILDEHLADGSGSDWLQTLRDEGHRHPALLITAAPTSDLRAVAEGLGASIAGKPLTPLKLRKLITAVLETKAAQSV